MKKILIALVCLGLFGYAAYDGKQQLSFVNYNTTGYTFHPQDYPVNLFFQNPPEKEYEVIGKIIGSVGKDMDIRKILEAWTRQSGGDGVIDIVISPKAMTKTSVEQELIDPGTSYETTRPVVVSRSYTAINIEGNIIKFK